MNKKEIGKEIETLIRSIKLHYDNIAEEVRIPTIELELITAKIRKLHEKSIIFNHLHMVEEQMMHMKRLEKELTNPDNDETSEENFIVNASELSTPLSVGSLIPEEIKTIVPTTEVPNFNEVISEAPVIEMVKPSVIEVPQPLQSHIISPAAASTIIEEVKPAVEPASIVHPINPEPIVETQSLEVENRSHSLSREENEISNEPTTLIDSNEIIGKDLKKIIGFSDKYFFISQLFAGNADDFNAELNALNKASDLTKAQAQLQKLVDMKAWKTESEAYQALNRYIQNKFN
jgi:hypothetical protein